MEDNYRKDLLLKLDKDLEDFLQEKQKESKVIRSKLKEEQEETDIDKLAEELRQHPAFLKEIDPTKKLHPLVEGLQALKYESDSPTENAEAFKEDGNVQFKRKKYRYAIDNYTKGIQEKAADALLNAQLHTNRAAAHWFLGNYRSSLNDCIIARKFVPDHMKAIMKGVQCCIELKRYADAVRWCDNGLLLNPTEVKLLDFRSKAEKLKHENERDQRKEKRVATKIQAAQKQLGDAIKKRGVRVAPVELKDAVWEAGNEVVDPLLLSNYENHHPSGAKVHLDTEGSLIWPVMFLYPEHTETDFIMAFHENNRLSDHIQAMFGSESPPWDTDHKYTPDKIKVYFEDREKEKLHQVGQSSTLAEVLAHERYVVQAGTPAFILLVSDAEYTKQFLQKYRS